MKKFIIFLGLAMILVVVNVMAYVHHIRVMSDYHEYGVDAKPTADTLKFYDIRNDTTYLLKTVTILQAQIDDDYQIDTVVICTTGRADVRISHCLLLSDGVTMKHYIDEWRSCQQVSGEGDAVLRLKVFAIDTSSSPYDTTAVQGCRVTLRFAVDSTEVGIQTTNSYGYTDWNVWEGDSYVANFSRPGYNFEQQAIVIPSPLSYPTGLLGYHEYDSAYGYNLTTENRCRIYAYTYDVEGNAEEDFELTAQLLSMGIGVEDTCGNTDRIAVVTFAKAKSDENGYAYIDVTRQKCLIGADYYNFIVRRGGRVVYRCVAAAPDTTEYNVTDLTCQ